MLAVDVISDYIEECDKGLHDEVTIDNVVEAGQDVMGEYDYFVVANAQKGAGGMGHNGTLIGNDIHGFRFIPKEGRDKSKPGSKIGGGPALPAADIRYKSFDAFLADPSQKEYNRFVFIPISHNKAQMLEGVMRGEANSYYHIIFNNCGHSVTNTLDYGGLPSFRATLPNNSFEMYKIISQTNKSWIYYER